MYFFFVSFYICILFFFFFSSRRRHTRYIGDWSSDVCSSDLFQVGQQDVHSTFSGQSRANFVTGDLDWFLGRHYFVRSEERRVGKECRSGWWRDHYREKDKDKKREIEK